MKPLFGAVLLLVATPPLFAANPENKIAAAIESAYQTQRNQIHQQIAVRMGVDLNVPADEGKVTILLRYHQERAATLMNVDEPQHLSPEIERLCTLDEMLVKSRDAELRRVRNLLANHKKIKTEARHVELERQLTQLRALVPDFEKAVYEVGGHRQSARFNRQRLAELRDALEKAMVLLDIRTKQHEALANRYAIQVLLAGVVVYTALIAAVLPNFDWTTIPISFGSSLIPTVITALLADRAISRFVERRADAKIAELEKETAARMRLGGLEQFASITYLADLYQKASQMMLCEHALLQQNTLEDTTKTQVRVADPLPITEEVEAVEEAEEVVAAKRAAR